MFAVESVNDPAPDFVKPPSTPAIEPLPAKVKSLTEFTEIREGDKEPRMFTLGLREPVLLNIT